MTKNTKITSVRDIGDKDHPPAVVGWWQKERVGSSGSQFCRRLNLTAQTWKAGFFFLPPEGLRGFYQWTSFILLEDWVNCKTKLQQSRTYRTAGPRRSSSLRTSRSRSIASCTLAPVIVIVIVDWLRSALSNVDSKYVDDEGGGLCNCNHQCRI